MAVRTTGLVLTGNDKRMNLCFYYSHYFGKNIIRRSSSLTRIRVSKESAFKGFRESGNRMKEASPIAASLYKLIPPEIKQYNLYRVLTGEALKMLKQGLLSPEIKENLKRIYIDPLQEEPMNKKSHAKIIRPKERRNIKNVNDFINYFPVRSTLNGRFRNRHRHAQVHQSSNLLCSDNISSNAEHWEEQKTRVLSNRTANPSSIPAKNPETEKSPTPEFIYVGRLPECKKLKMWMRPVFNVEDL